MEDSREDEKAAFIDGEIGGAGEEGESPDYRHKKPGSVAGFLIDRIL